MAHQPHYKFYIEEIPGWWSSISGHTQSGQADSVIGVGVTRWRLRWIDLWDVWVIISLRGLEIGWFCFEFDL